MSRLKMMSMFIIATLALAALCIIPAMTFAAHTQPTHAATPNSWVKSGAQPNTPVPLYVAFSATVTHGQGKGSPIVGGLTLEVRQSGLFTGKFVAPGKTFVNVNGQILGTSVVINILQEPGNVPIITGQATINTSNVAVGVFQVFSNSTQVADGIWSGLPTGGPSSQLSLAFYSRVTSGPDTKIVYTCPIELNATSLPVSVTVDGTCNLSNGLVLTVRATVDHTGHIEVNLQDGGPLHIVAVGIPFYSQVLMASGYDGTFVGPRQHDTGSWSSAFFAFTAM